MSDQANGLSHEGALSELDRVWTMLREERTRCSKLAFDRDETIAALQAEKDIAIAQHTEAVEAGLELLERIKELEALAFRSYCAGYERGHNDTVESHYAPPVEYPEEWAEILNDLQVEPPIEQEG